MSEVQVKIVHSLYHEVFEKDLAAALTEGWQIADIKTIPVEGTDFTVHSLLAILRRGGNEPVRGQGWMLGAIEGLQAQVATLKAKLRELDHVLDVDLSGIGSTKDEAHALMQEQFYEAINEGWRGADEVEGKHDVHVEFWTPEEMQQYVKFQRLARVDLIDAEIAADLAAGVG